MRQERQERQIIHERQVRHLGQVIIPTMKTLCFVPAADWRSLSQISEMTLMEVSVPGNNLEDGEIRLS